MAQKRLEKEFLQFSKDPPSNCYGGPVNNNNIFKWEAIILGPKDSPYENGVFRLSIVYSIDYPFKPPIVKFLTKIYHMNINDAGYICLDILKDNWSPALTTSKLLISICSLLNDPNPNDPLVAEYADIFKKDKPLYMSRAKEWTLTYAS